MNDKIKHYQILAETYVTRLGDVRFLGQVVFGIIVLLISWSGVRAIQTNYSLQKQISALKQQNTVQQLLNNNLKLENQYYNTDQYLELSARQNLNLAAPGEKEILVPKSVALANTVDLGTATPSPAKPDTRPAYQRNYQAWLQFFLHRQNSTE